MCPTCGQRRRWHPDPVEPVGPMEEPCPMCCLGGYDDCLPAGLVCFLCGNRMVITRPPPPQWTGTNHLQECGCSTK